MTHRPRVALQLDVLGLAEDATKPESDLIRDVGGLSQSYSNPVLKAWHVA